MKKSLKSLIMMLAVVPFLFTSCGIDDNAGHATIKFDAASVEITDGTVVITGEVTSPENTTISVINVFCVYGDGQTNDAAVATIKDLTKVADNKYTFRFDEKSAGIKDHLTDMVGLKINAEVKNGDISSKTLDVKVVGEESPKLSDAVEFTLGRPGTEKNPASANGIEWTSNLSATKARFTATHVSLSKEKYEAIETVEALIEEYNAGTPNTTFEAESDANFKTQYMIVKDEDTYRLIQMTDLKFSEGNNVAVFTEKH